MRKIFHRFNVAFWCILIPSHAIDLSTVIDVVTNADLSENPSKGPSASPSLMPSSSPTLRPSSRPTSLPTFNPSSSPTIQPTSSPSTSPTRHPSSSPSFQPSPSPSFHPTFHPTKSPTGIPSYSPTELPRFSIEIMVRLHNQEGTMTGNVLDEFQKAVQEFAADCYVPGKKTIVDNIEVTSQTFRNSTNVIFFDVNGKSEFRTTSSIAKALRACFYDGNEKLFKVLKGENVDETPKRNRGISNSQMAAIISSSLVCVAAGALVFLFARYRRRKFLREAQFVNHHFSEEDIFPEEMFQIDEILAAPSVTNERSIVTIPSGLHSTDSKSYDVSRTSMKFLEYLEIGTSGNSSRRRESARQELDNISIGRASHDTTKNDQQSSIMSYNVPGGIAIDHSVIGHVQRIHPDAVRNSQDSVSTGAIEKACGGRLSCFQTPEMKRDNDKIGTKISFVKGNNGDIKSIQNRMDLYPTLVNQINGNGKIEEETLGEETLDDLNKFLDEFVEETDDDYFRPDYDEISNDRSSGSNSGSGETKSTVQSQIEQLEQMHKHWLDIK